MLIDELFCGCNTKRLPLQYSDLNATINLQSEPIPFAGGSNIIISHLEMDYFQNCMN